jgi:hypothetical protein
MVLRAAHPRSGEAADGVPDEAPVRFRSRCRNRSADRRVLQSPGACHAATASSVNQTVEVSPPDQSRIVFGPVHHAVSGLRDLVTAVLVEFVRHQFQQPLERAPTKPYRPAADPAIHPHTPMAHPCTNATFANIANSFFQAISIRRSTWRATRGNRRKQVAMARSLNARWDIPADRIARRGRLADWRVGALVVDCGIDSDGVRRFFRSGRERSWECPRKIPMLTG